MTSTGPPASEPTSRRHATRGVNLAFFSGNESYWKTRWEPVTDGSSTPYRTLVSYKEGSAAGSEHYNCQGNYQCDPDPVSGPGCGAKAALPDPGSTDGCEPENALSGQISWNGTVGIRGSGAVRTRFASGATPRWLAQSSGLS